MFEIRTVSLVHINRFVFLALALGIARGLLPGPAAANTLAVWVELVGPDMEASIRAIVSTDSTCPELQLGDETVQMQVRAEPGPSVLAEKQAEFPVRVCEVKVPAAERKITLEGVAIPVPAGEFKRIVIVGDTGCRIKKKNTQDCNDPKYWPYPRLANQAADARPDLVIHVGDYLYREKSCQGRTDECPESPVGYGWNIWDVDFFAPSARLLAAAPWIMVRGNHETCKRAGEGWFRFLDHGPFPKKCPKADIGDFFVTGSKGVRFAVMDSAAMAKDEDDLGEEDDVSSGDVENPDALLQQKFEKIAGKLDAPTWLLSHAPFNAVRLNKDADADEVDDTIQQRALGSLLPATVKLIVSGHVHAFEALSFKEANPAHVPQLVVGDSGTKLAREPHVPNNVSGAPVTSGVVFSHFGYMVWDREGTNWNGQLFDERGSPRVRCKLIERDLSCKKED